MAPADFPPLPPLPICPCRRLPITELLHRFGIYPLRCRHRRVASRPLVCVSAGTHGAWLTLIVDVGRLQLAGLEALRHRVVDTSMGCPGMHLACCESQWRRARSTASGRSLSGSSNGCEGLTCPRTLLVRHIHLGFAFACHQTHRLYFGSTQPRRYYIHAHCIGGGSVDIEHNAQLSISRTCRPSDPPHRLSLDW